MPDYTQLSVASSASFSILGTPTNAWSGAFAEGVDSITIDSSALDGLPGRFSLNYALDFTLRLLPLLVTDTLGNPVPDAQFTSASVPEGSSLLMLASGLMTLILLRLATPEYSLSRLAPFRRTIQLRWLQKVASSDRRPRAKN